MMEARNSEMVSLKYYKKITAHFEFYDQNDLWAILVVIHRYLQKHLMSVWLHSLPFPIFIMGRNLKYIQSYVRYVI